jgi:GNAT superfamily N-acetyltransferase
MSASRGISIRRLEPADVHALADLARDTFVETFGHLYRPADLAAFLKTAHAPETYQAFLADSRVGIWVALRGPAELVGYGLAGPCKLPVPGLEASAGEIRQLYLRASAQGDGLGTRLLVTMLEWLGAHGHTPLYVGVWSGNTGAQRLYARFGFDKIGEYDFPVGEHLDREFIFRQQKAPQHGHGIAPV